jgi:phage virion morphogenesis protein
MTGAAITIDAKLDDEAARAAFAGLAAAGADLSGVMADIGQQVVTNTLLRFEAGKGPSGMPWKKSRRAENGGGQTLVKSGILRTSIHAQASASDVIVGTNVRYTAIHQFGGDVAAKKAKMLKFKVDGHWISKERVHIPARPFLGLDADDRADILDIATDHLRAASGGAVQG